MSSGEIVVGSPLTGGELIEGYYARIGGLWLVISLPHREIIIKAAQK